MAKTLSIDDMKQLATENGGWCLSDEYVNQLTKLNWKCSEGHIWDATPKNIRKGTWCPICALKSENRKKRVNVLTIDDMRQIAKEHGGVCLSDAYVVDTKLLWQCSEGHIWETYPKHIRKGSWCPVCSHKNRTGKKRNIVTIDDMRRIAEEQGGACLSDTYINAGTKLLWKCSEGHMWEAIPSNIKKGSWCPTCSKKKNGSYSRYDMEKLHQIAQSKGGKCLEEEYTYSHEKISWQCKEGHIFQSPPIYIVNGSWCPYCSGRLKNSIEKMHEIAKEHGGKCLSTSYKNVFTHLLWECANGHQFNSIPKHVINGHWCPNCTTYLNEQRCRYILETLFDTKFIKDRNVLDGLELDGYNDDLKLAFEYHGKQHFEQVDFFYSRGDMNLNDRIERDSFKEKRCEELEIELLIIPYTIEPEEQSSFIANELTKRGFQFKVQPSDITFDNYLLTNQELKEIQDIAISKGGKCLSNVYITVDTKLNFICEKGHHFSKTPYYIKKGQWCRTCSYEKRGDLYRLDSNEMHLVAKEKGWKCLSEEYINAREKLLWECENGHIFERALGYIKEGRGCPECLKLKRHNRKV